MSAEKYTVALAGNPNCGKTTLFNMLTGSNQYVGNWAGVTVEKKSGKFKKENCEIELVDLPGIYSLSPYTMEEVITRDFIADEHPDVVLNIVDGTNFERNLYLSMQLTELGMPMVIAVNMADSMRARGDQCDFEGLSKTLGVPMVPISAKKGDNIDALVKAVIKAAREKITYPHPEYDRPSHKAIDKIKDVIKTVPGVDLLHINFYASKLLEGDPEVAKKERIDGQTLKKVEQIAREYEQTSPYGDRETMLADARYRYITGLMDKFLIKKQKPGQLTLSDKIDAVVTNRFLAIPIFLLIMLTVFLVTFGPAGEFLKGGISYLIDDLLAPSADKLLTGAGAPEWTHSLLVDGVIAGVGAVLSFLPQIMLLFLFLSILEDSGYMSRAAFVMDSFLRKIGLNGKAFIPMLMGFGCTVPAVMAARTMENDRERKLTIMLVPFMSCAARMPIYALFAGAFFEKNRGLAVFSIYILGIIVAVITGLVLKKTLFKKNNAPFILELPEYRLPSLNTLMLHLWDKCRDFLVRAGTLIFSMTVIVWVLQNFDFTFHPAASGEESIIGRLGMAVAPVFIPLGFGTWQAVVSLLSGFVAKEAVVSSMAVLYGAASQEALGAMLPSIFTPASAYAFMVFTLLYMPCVAAFGAIKREMNSWRWAIGSVALQTSIAYVLALLVYQIGSLIA